MSCTRADRPVPPSRQETQRPECRRHRAARHARCSRRPSCEVRTDGPASRHPTWAQSGRSQRPDGSRSQALASPWRPGGAESCRLESPRAALGERSQPRSWARRWAPRPTRAWASRRHSTTGTPEWRSLLPRRRQRRRGRARCTNAAADASSTCAVACLRDHGPVCAIVQQ